jgi:hypothetical protein
MEGIHYNETKIPVARDQLEENQKVFQTLKENLNMQEIE